MIHLDIDSMEKEELRDLLQHCLNWLKHEVHHTDARALREKLKQREKIIQDLLDQLESDTNR